MCYLLCIGLIALSLHLSGDPEPGKERVFSATTFTDTHMASRLSNRARIQQKADEAAAAEEQKTEKKKVAKKKTTRKKASKKTADSGQPQKLVWKVFNASFKEMGCFPYPEKAKAYKMAEDLDKMEKGKHFVNAVKV
jgi:hypothetical protein